MVVEAEVLVAGVDEETTDELADEAADVPELDALSLYTEMRLLPPQNVDVSPLQMKSHAPGVSILLSPLIAFEQ